MTTRTSAKRSWSRSARRESSSTSVSERRGLAAIFSVRMPRPGPISITESDSHELRRRDDSIGDAARWSENSARAISPAARRPARAPVLDAMRFRRAARIFVRSSSYKARDSLPRRCSTGRARRAAGGSCPRARSSPRCRCSISAPVRPAGARRQPPPRPAVSRNLEFAATPPVSAIVSAPSSRAAAIVGFTSISTTAS